LFSGPMARAILEGRKTQTRRVVKGTNVWGEFIHQVIPLATPGKFRLEGANSIDPLLFGHPKTFVDVLCPYGQPGDRLWVREGFAAIDTSGTLSQKLAYRADGESQFLATMKESNGRVTDYWTDHWVLNGERKRGGCWKPSIHMPRWASRLTLEIVGIRVERLQDISEADAIAEGVDAVSIHDMPRQASWNRRQDFSRIWEIINGPGSWGANPWVWVVEFKVVKP
jgi:hypothetical protein